MKTKHVFLDTSIYILNNFDFESLRFLSLINLVSQNRIVLYHTSITDNEVISNIKKSVDETRQLVNSLIGDAYVLRNTSPFKSVFAEKKAVNKAMEEINKKYVKFKEAAGLEFIPISNVDMDDVFSRYFNATPPFSAKKKDEIPDAVTLSAIKQKFESEDQTCYIISTDSDMKEYCKEVQVLTYLESIDSLLDIITQEDNDTRYKIAMNVFESKRDDILELIQDNLFDHSFELQYLEGTVDEIYLGEVELAHEPYIIEIEEEENTIKFSLQISFDYTAHCSILDEETSPYDSETKGYLWKEYREETFHEWITIEVEVEVSHVDFNNMINNDFGIDDLEILDENIDKIELEIKEINKSEPIFIKYWYYD